MLVILNHVEGRYNQIVGCNWLTFKKIKKIQMLGYYRLYIITARAFFFWGGGHPVP